MAGRSFALTVGKLIVVITVLSTAATPLCAFPQQDSSPDTQSLADAARRSREQAKNATKPSKVISNDDLDKSNVKPGAQGLTVDAPAKLETQPPTQGAVAEAATTPTPTSGDAATAPAVTDDPETAQLKEQLADAEKDADLLKRDLTLQQDTVLSNPDQEHDRAGKAKLAEMQQQISAKQQDVDRLKTQLAAVQERKKQPAPPSQPTAPANPAAPANAPGAPATAPTSPSSPAPPQS